MTEDQVSLSRRLRGAAESDLAPVYGPSGRENLLDIGFDRFRNVREEIMNLPSEMLRDGQAIDVRKILVDPDAPQVTIGEGQANGRVGQHRVHLGRSLRDSPLQGGVEAFDLLFHLLEFGDIDQDPVPAGAHVNEPGTAIGVMGVLVNGTIGKIVGEEPKSKLAVEQLSFLRVFAH